jgi:hypothetical protein
MLSFVIFFTFIMLLTIASSFTFHRRLPTTAGRRLFRHATTSSLSLDRAYTASQAALSPLAFRFLSEPVTKVKGVGSKFAECLDKLGIVTVSDLLFHFPVKMLDRRELKTDISESVEGSTVSFKLTATSRMKKGMGRAPHVFTCIDSKGNEIDIQYFTGNPSYSFSVWQRLEKIFRPNAMVS